MNAMTPDFPMPILTPSLILRPVQISDASQINEAVLESFDILHEFMDWANTKPSIEDTQEYAGLAASSWINKSPEEPWLQLAIIDRKTNQFIGGTSFHHFDWNIPSVETGYWIRSSRARQGLMAEAINAMTQYAVKQLRVKRIAITCDKDNARGKNIPERLGYVLEATLKNHRRKPMSGELSDTLVYARYDCNEMPELEVTWGNN